MAGKSRKTERLIDEINKMRKRQNLPLINDFKVKICLKCRKKFETRELRICTYCTLKNKDTGADKGFTIYE